MVPWAPQNLSPMPTHHPPIIFASKAPEVGDDQVRVGEGSEGVETKQLHANKQATLSQIQS